MCLDGHAAQSLVGGCGAPWTQRLERVAVGAAARHGGRAVRACLPDRLQRSTAPGAGLLEARRADGADHEARLDHGAADGAFERPQAQPLLDRADLELTLTNVLEVLRRTQEEVDDRAEKRDGEPDQRRQADQPVRPIAGARP